MRRTIPQVLTLVPVLALLVGTAGCLTAGNAVTTPSETPFRPATTDTRSVTTSPPTTGRPGSTVSPATAVLPNVPKPRDNCTVRSLPDGAYPDLPAEVTESSVENFALEFEQTNRWETLAADPDTTVSGFDGWDVDTVRQTDAGYVVSVTVSLDFVTESEGTVTLAGSTNSHGRYYVTEEFAVRAPSGPASVPDSGWETVAFGEEDGYSVRQTRGRDLSVRSLAVVVTALINRG